MTAIIRQSDLLIEKKKEQTAAVEHRIEQLKKSLGVAEKIKSEEETLLKWIESAETSISSDFNVRALPELCDAELQKIDVSYNQLFHLKSNGICKRYSTICIYN